MIKRLARLSEIHTPEFSDLVRRVNQFTSGTALRQYIPYSRIWEYPWAWLQLESLKGRGLKLLDIGSEISPFAWFLASQGFSVTLSDVTADYWRVWKSTGRLLGLNPDRCILDAQNLDLPTASQGVYLSVSVIEHIPDKQKVISEAARVLKPGGLMVLTFDICEPDMGMSFPEWNGRALTMREFDALFEGCPWFEAGLSERPWNTEAIPEYLTWHRTTAPHHNYVTGAAVIRRSERAWEEGKWKNQLRDLRGKGRTVSSLSTWHARRTFRRLRRSLARPLGAVARRRNGFSSTPLELLPDSPDIFRVYRNLEKNLDVERKPGGWIYKGGFYPDYLTVGGAGHAIFGEALEFCKGHGVDIGAAFWPLPGAVPIDAARGPGAEASISSFADESLDYVFSSHCLEHIEEWRQALAEWIGKLKAGGVVFLYLPHPDCAIWHPGSPFVGDSHKWVPEPDIVKEALSRVGCEIVGCDDGPDAMQSFYVCARKHARTLR
jgi:SAM-dependent methyltransferase